MNEKNENENKKKETISVFAHEAEMDRMERMNKRLLCLVIAVLTVSLLLFIANNILWMKHNERERADLERIYETNSGIHQQSNNTPD